MEFLHLNMMKFMLDFFRVGKWLNASILCACGLIIIATVVWINCSP